MLRITFVILSVLLCGHHADVSRSNEAFRFYVEHVASVYHGNWRTEFVAKNPSVRNRFKLTRSAVTYKASDFVYPMILTVGSCLVHRNLKVARSRTNASLIYVDILNMAYAELPPDWTEENRATARLACRFVLHNLRRQRLFGAKFFEHAAETIHIQWMKRNEQHASKHLLVPYANLTETEKSKDRQAVLLACRVFNELLLYRRFNTTPVQLVNDSL